ncbi:hypothetical protein A2755_03985 [Candidatus Wolfebacteria bacterium RIFCSPHIGHO2_01_FULL_48_22]|uniref:Peptidase M16 n=2 Tax=Candidatus Wolfeibacteriota TaxID=1752735 RepID=A0A1F8DPG0_9BACT|nr:MAG: hypothetical protein A2755_03985 [Candidatus Wolfebacteria bacterium RIFCSPHIGHO2_01_FULL_48_22]OGM93498.1 MAG: hypothetical protein A2935_01335 [Candidatus Wolfebacteria bacterium RIFCSPLOWO2_01_FULL_47_17b]
MKVIQKKLPNSIRLILVPLKDSLSVTTAVFVEAGSAYEQKKISGLSHFLEHMMFKGTTRRPTARAISTELENLGASYNAFTDFDLTGYYATVAPRNFDKAFDVVADMYLHPLLDPKEIEKEKGVIVEEIRMYEDLPQYKASETLDALMHGDQPSGWSIVGTEKTVTSFNRKNFQDYIAKHYIAEKTIIVVAGNFDPAYAYAEAKKHFAAARKGKVYDRVPYKKHTGRHISIVHKKLDQSTFMAGFHAVPMKSDERFKVAILAAILGGGMGSRLFQKIREEMGAAYFIGMGTSFNANHGVAYVKGGINHGKLRDVFSALCEELQKIHEGAAKDELTRAKEYTVGNFLLSLESPSELGTYYGYQEATMGKTLPPQEAAKHMRAVTQDDIKRIARKYLTKENFHFSLVGPYEKAEEKKYEELYRKNWA